MGSRALSGPILAVSVGLALAGMAAVTTAAAALRREATERRAGKLVSVEVDRPRTLRSERFRLVGRPDEIRRTPDGRWVPVELKHRGAPRAGSFFSHTVQVWAYCLLLEENTGRAPPFGVLRYTDREVTVPWNDAARSALLELYRRAGAPYDGRADPSPAKCATCVWDDRCDASAARHGGSSPRPVLSSAPR